MPRRMKKHVDAIRGTRRRVPTLSPVHGDERLEIAVNLLVTPPSLFDFAVLTPDGRELGRWSDLQAASRSFVPPRPFVLPAGGTARATLRWSLDVRSAAGRIRSLAPGRYVLVGLL